MIALAQLKGVKKYGLLLTICDRMPENSRLGEVSVALLEVQRFRDSGRDGLIAARSKQWQQMFHADSTDCQEKYALLILIDWSLRYPEALRPCCR